MPQWLFFPIFLWTRGAFFGFGGLSFFPLSAQLHGGWRGGSKYGNAIGRDSAPVALLAYVWFFFPLRWSSLLSISLLSSRMAVECCWGLVCRFLHVRSMYHNERELFLHVIFSTTCVCWAMQVANIPGHRRAVASVPILPDAASFVCREAEG